MYLDFKDYKEKQKYYKERSKQKKTFWVSMEGQKNSIIKGRTYIKPKEVKNGNDSK